METADMGRVVTEATIYNSNDWADAKRGVLAPEQVRKVTVPDASVDTGASTLGMPRRLIEQLGLVKYADKRAMTMAGVTTIAVYGTARLEIMGREYPTDVLEVPDECPVVIGQLPLEAMDWVIDMKTHKLIGNPAHGGEHILDLL